MARRIFLPESTLNSHVSCQNRWWWIFDRSRYIESRLYWFYKIPKNVDFQNFESHTNFSQKQSSKTILLEKSNYSRTRFFYTKFPLLKSSFQSNFNSRFPAQFLKKNNKILKNKIFQEKIWQKTKFPGSLILSKIHTNQLIPFQNHKSRCWKQTTGYFHWHIIIINTGLEACAHGSSSTVKSYMLGLISHALRFRNSRLFWFSFPCIEA